MKPATPTRIPVALIALAAVLLTYLTVTGTALAQGPATFVGVSSTQLGPVIGVPRQVGHPDNPLFVVSDPPRSAIQVIDTATGQVGYCRMPAPVLDVAFAYREFYWLAFALGSKGIGYARVDDLNVCFQTPWVNLPVRMQSIGKYVGAVTWAQHGPSIAEHHNHYAYLVASEGPSRVGKLYLLEWQSGLARTFGLDGSSNSNVIGAILRSSGSGDGTLVHVAELGRPQSKVVPLYIVGPEISFAAPPIEIGGQCETLIPSGVKPIESS